MLVRATRHGDVELPGGTVKAVFPGQLYDLPDDLVTGDLFEKAQQPVSDKAVEPGDVRNKSVRGRRAQ